jgi:hypothetical protein
MTAEPKKNGFVVWIDGAGAPGDLLTGSVECVRSAERARFEGRDELLDLIERWVARAKPMAPD